MMKPYALLLAALLSCPVLFAQKPDRIPPEVMRQTYEEVKTPYKYGLIMVPEPGKMIDCPSIFRDNGKWFMTYIVFDGKGYESWLAESADLLHWKTLGRIMSFTDGTWDATQKAGYIALQDTEWGGSNAPEPFEDHYWMSYIGGSATGYEAGKLGIGIARTKTPAEAREWERLRGPVLSAEDPDARWFETDVLYKSTIIRDPDLNTGHPFVMFYNAKSKLRPNNRGIERIGMAVSNDMRHWKRFGDQPVIDNGAGITGDAQIVRISDLWVMFYFGEGWRPGAFDQFACSYDLKNWTRWEGENLISPSESFDNQYAHKPMVLKYDGVVYHFYNAVDKQGNRGLALATSQPVGKSELSY